MKFSSPKVRKIAEKLVKKAEKKMDKEKDENLLTRLSKIFLYKVFLLLVLMFFDTILHFVKTIISAFYS